MLRLARPILAALALCGLAAPLAGADEPVRRALLIGASGYDESRIGEGVELFGPRNDVALMIRALRRYGVEDRHMTVLADGLDQTGIDFVAHGEPRLAEITAAFDTLDAETRPGDEVMIYMSGHGSRQPQTGNPASPEPDRFDEIFLPLDIGAWEGAHGDREAGVQNALLDDRIGTLVDSLRDRGVFVWLVVDTCHSGTANRSGAGAGDGMRTRQLDMAALGIPAEAILEAESAVSTTRGAPGPAAPELEFEGGGYVAFFAAHSGQLALEGLLPRTGDADARNNYGVMTFQIATSLLAGGVSTYRDLAYRVLNGYDDWGARAPVPLFEGDLDRPVFGLTGAPGEVSWPVERAGRDSVEIAAGALNGIGEGAIFELAVIDPDTQEAHPSFPGPFFLRASEVAETRTLAELTDHDGHDAARRVPAYGFLTARLVDPGVRFELGVAIADFPPRPDARERLAMAALEQLATADPAGLTAPLAFREAAAAADVRVVIEDAAVWFLRSGESVTRDPRTMPAHIELADHESTEAFEAAIERELAKIARARNLLRASQALAQSGSLEALEVRAYVWRPDAPAPTASATAPDDWPCTLPDARRIPDTALSLAQMNADALDTLELGHCDIVYLEIYNAGEHPIDVTPLYLDSLAGIYRMPYLGEETSTRIEPGAPPRVAWAGLRTWDWDADEPSSTGLERLVLLAVEREDRTALPFDFAYLAQDALSRDAADAARSGPLAALLTGAAFGGGTTRSAGTSAALDGSAGARIFQWRLVPPQEDRS